MGNTDQFRDLPRWKIRYLKEKNKIFRWGEHPLLLGGWFFLGNLSLAYFPLPLTTQLWVAVIFLILPLVVVLGEGSVKKKPGEKPIYLFETFKFSPAGEWILLIGLCLFFRLYLLTGLSTWPRLDEGLLDFSALELSQTWHFKFFYAYTQLPPLYFWLLAVFFRIFHPSLFSSWLFPALFSILSCLLGLLAARQYFSRSFSLILGLLLCGGFWPAYMARFSIPDVVLMPVEMGCLWLLFLYLKENHPGTRRRLLLALGAVLGIGFYTYQPWPAFTLLVIGVIGMNTEKKIWREALFTLGGSLVLVLSPLALALMREDFGSYLQRIWAGSSTDWSYQTFITWNYLRAILWGSTQGDYGPIFGGLLNPIAATFFLLGALEAWRKTYGSLRALLLGGTFILLLPGLLTNTLEFHRIIAALPFFLFLEGWGLIHLTAALPPKARTPGLVLFLSLVIILDALHLFVWYPARWAQPSSQWPVNIKSVEYYDAYRLVQRRFLTYGPGALLEELQPDPFDRTLTIAAFTFDTSRNPKWGFEDSRWVAVLANIHYLPFLQKRFPEADFSRLKAPEKAQYGGELLMIVPVTQANRPVLKKWYEVNRALQLSSSLMQERREHQTREKIFQALTPVAPLIQGDPFLTSCFWEKWHVQLDLEAAYGDKKLEAIYQPSLQAVEYALKDGYPAAHLYNELGVFLNMGGKTKEAKASFQKALTAPLDETPAKRNLEALNRQN